MAVIHCEIVDAVTQFIEEAAGVLAICLFGAGAHQGGYLHLHRLQGEPGLVAALLLFAVLLFSGIFPEAVQKAEIIHKMSAYSNHAFFLASPSRLISSSSSFLRS
jgi:hypothetical protein